MGTLGSRRLLFFHLDPAFVDHLLGLREDPWDHIHAHRDYRRPHRGHYSREQAQYMATLVTGLENRRTGSTNLNVDGGNFDFANL